MDKRIELVKAKNVVEAAELAPWAEVILKSERGWVCFATFAIYTEWKNEQLELSLPARKQA